MKSEPAIVLRDLSKRYGKRGTLAVSGVSAEVVPGSVVALVGPNGSGKSTLLGLLVGLLKPSSGYALVLDSTPKRGAEILQRIGYLGSDDALYPDLTVNENLIYRCTVRGTSMADSRQLVSTALERFGIGSLADRYPLRLSTGQKQRVLLASAIAHKPDVLLLDEPTSALDISALNQFYSFVQSAGESGTTILVATHHPSDIYALSTHTMVLHGGRLMSFGETSTLASNVDELRNYLISVLSDPNTCAA